MPAGDLAVHSKMVYFPRCLGLEASCSFPGQVRNIVDVSRRRRNCWWSQVFPWCNPVCLQRMYLGSVSLNMAGIKNQDTAALFILPNLFQVSALPPKTLSFSFFSWPHSQFMSQFFPWLFLPLLLWCFLLLPHIFPSSFCHRPTLLQNNTLWPLLSPTYTLHVPLF